ncbi:MAG: ABC transporter ATP-binding protein, partial [Lachnospiraceae bacterium]|nr:ABC transporter ATP-binding protein [Lachnospiraceae bacterium]
MKKRTLSWLFGRIKQHIPKLVLLTVLNVLQALSGVAIAVQSKRMLDIATKEQALAGESFVTAALVLAAIVLAFIVLRLLSQHLKETLNILMDRDWKKELLSRLLHGRFQDVKAYHSGELVNRLSADVKNVDDGIVSVIPGFAAMGARFLSATVALFILAPILTVILLSIGLFVILITTAFRRLLKDLHKKVSAENGKANAFLQEVLEKLLMVQSMDVSDEVEKRGEKVFEDRAAVQKKRRKYSVFGMTGLSFIMSILYYGSLIFMAAELLNGRITVGTLTAVTQLVGQMQNPIVNLSSVVQAYIAMLGSAERLRELYEIPEEESGELPENTDNAFDEIRAENVVFTYPE